MRVTLMAVAGPGKGRQFTVRPGDVIVVGRTEWSDVSFESDQQMSARHFAVELNGQAIRLIDQRSTNGTQVNGEPVLEAPLQNGDQVIAGTTHFVVQIENDQAAPAESPYANQGNGGSPIAYGDQPTRPEPAFPGAAPPVGPPPGQPMAGGSPIGGGSYSPQPYPDSPTAPQSGSPGQMSPAPGGGSPIFQSDGNSGSPSEPPAGQPPEPMMGGSPIMMGGDSMQDSGAAPPKPPEANALPPASSTPPSNSTPPASGSPLGQTPMSGPPPVANSPLGGNTPFGESSAKTAPEFDEPIEAMPVEADSAPSPPKGSGSPISPIAPGGPPPSPEPASGPGAPSAAPPPSSPAPSSPTPLSPTPSSPTPGDSGSPPSPTKSGADKAEAKKPEGSFKVKAATPASLQFSQHKTRSTVVKAFRSNYQDQEVEFTAAGLIGKLKENLPLITIVQFQKAGMEVPEGLTDVIPLFSWLPEETAINFGPVIIPPTEQVNVLELFDEAWDQDSIMAVFSPNVDEAIEHLKELIRFNINGPDDEEGLFGYCWPGVISVLLENQEREIVERIYAGKIDSFVCEVPGTEGNWQLFGPDRQAEMLTKLGFREIPLPEEDAAE